MQVLSEHAVFIFVAQLGVILLAARIFGEIAVKFGQPIIVGEVLAGIILGPGVFGRIPPDLRTVLFPSEGIHPNLLQGISWLCVLFLLMITGLEIDFRASLRQGKISILLSLICIGLPMLGVFAASSFLPAFLYPEGSNTFFVNILLSVALSVVAIPVIAKILFDLKILKSEVGLKILTAGVLSDVWGWSILAVVISLITTGEITLGTILKPLVMMFLYIGFALTVGHRLVDKIFDLIGYKKMDTNLTLSLLFSLALLNGAIAHLLGIHVIFGAFIAGIMAGESNKITPYIRQWTQDFIFAVFAPIFFVLVGMQLQFKNAETILPILLLLFVSSVCRVGGSFVGAGIAGMGRKNALAVSVGLNTQGTMGIIVGLIGYEMGIFNDDMFTVIVVICILTSLSVGPLLKWAIKGVKRPLAKFFDREHVFLDVAGFDKTQVIKNIAKLMAKRNLIENPKNIEKAIMEREATLSTAIGEGVALPHARIRNLKTPILCFFRLKSPIEYGAPDNKPVQLLFVELTDYNDDGMQLNLIAQVARFIALESNRKKLIECQKEDDIHHILSFDDKA